MIFDLNFFLEEIHDASTISYFLLDQKVTKNQGFIGFC
jgi:hypothetical protein